MKFMKLLTAAYVNGLLRHPHEGVIHVDDDEGQRLLDNEAAEDVSGDFTDEQAADAPLESLSAATPTDGVIPAPEPARHQSEVAPQATEVVQPAADPAAENQE